MLNQSLYFQWSKAEDPDFQQEGEFLVLPGITADHSGLYTCTATNVIGNDSISLYFKSYNKNVLFNFTENML